MNPDSFTIRPTCDSQSSLKHVVHRLRIFIVEVEQIVVLQQGGPSAAGVSLKTRAIRN